MKTVHEVSKITGLSARALHHYDAIGLFKPAKVTEAGYRIYEDGQLRRLQSILFFRELEFPLKEIKAILDDPAFDEKQALESQLKILEAKKNHIEKLIALARKTITQGVTDMDFSAFDKTELETLSAEAKEKWGLTPQYREYEQKAKNQSESEKEENANKMMAVFAELGKLKTLEPDDERVQTQIRALQNFITETSYTCTKGALACLGQMYVGDERFRKNIDLSGGDGTAEFAAKAIEIYCK